MADIALILTRPEPGAGRFLSALSAEARAVVMPVLSPLMTIEPLDWSGEIGPEVAAIFTSANGVRFAPEGVGRRAFCVGAETARAAMARGWRAEQAGQTADALVDKLTAARGTAPLVHFAGVHRRGGIAERLVAAGCSARVVEVYDQRLHPLTEAALEALAGPAIVPLFSPRTAEQFARETRSIALGHVHLVAMSAAVAQPLSGKPVAGMRVADAPTREEMVLAVEKLCRHIRLP